MEYLKLLFDGGGYVRRGFCGGWSPVVLNSDRVANAAIFLIFLSIAVLLYTYARNNAPLLKNGLPYSFASFLLFAGAAHLILFIETFVPLYRLGVLVELATAIAAGSTAGNLAMIIKKAGGAISIQSLTDSR